MEYINEYHPRARDKELSKDNLSYHVNRKTKGKRKKFKHTRTFKRDLNNLIREYERG